MIDGNDLPPLRKRKNKEIQLKFKKTEKNIPEHHSLTEAPNAAIADCMADKSRKEEDHYLLL